MASDEGLSREISVARSDSLLCDGTAASLRNGRGECEVALLLSGNIGERGTNVSSIWEHVIVPLHDLRYVVDTFACLDPTDERTPYVKELSQWPQSRLFFDDFSKASPNRMTRQMARLASCWRRTLDEHIAPRYSLFVYARPDLLWWDALVVPTVDAVTTRVREIRLLAGERIFQQQVEFPCASHAKSFGTSIMTDEHSNAKADDCFFVGDQLAIVPAQFARWYFDDEEDLHAPKQDCRTRRRPCALPYVTRHDNLSSEWVLTHRLLRGCVPILIHPFNVSLGVKNATTGTAPGGPGELRTVSAHHARSNVECVPHHAGPVAG